jgi:hypothetical protein
VNVVNDHNLRFSGLQKTKLRDASMDLLNSLSGRHSFSWVIANSICMFGGMLLGVHNDFYE